MQHDSLMKKPPSNYRLQKVVSRTNIIQVQLWERWHYCVNFSTMQTGMQKGGAKNKDLAIEAYNRIQNLPAIFEANNKLDVARAVKIGQEFNLPFIVTANGREYEHLQVLKDLDAQLLVPLAFPKAFDVTDPVSTQKIALSDLRYWNQAPANPAKIAEAGIPFALTTKGLKNPIFTHILKKLWPMA